MPLKNSFKITHTPDHVLVDFRRSHSVLSSSVFNGGFQEAENILIMKVPENLNGKQSRFEEPSVILSKYAGTLQLKGACVGMMTAASMDSFRRVSRSCPQTDVTVLLTAGISNARCAGDRADWMNPETESMPAGTINIIVIAGARMSPAAMVEAVITTTEAKAVTMRRLGIKSPTSGSVATGTGTDAIAIVSGNGPAEIQYCGKHVKFGEVLASAVIEALTNSLGP
jgi:adenosylcobinamide amidohydrolase